MFIETKDQPFENLLHIPEPWHIARINFDFKKKQLDIYVKIRRRGLFTCSNCQTTLQPIYDIPDDNRTWRHMNFFQYPCYIHAEHPRTKCDSCSKIRRVDVPWAVKPKWGFTLDFDAFILTLAKDMPMNAISQLIGEHDTRLWRIVHYYVDQVRASQDLSHVTKISVDETSAKRGHRYVTIFMDAEKKYVICATPGKDSATLRICKEYLESHNGDAEQIEEICMDMSPAFIKGAAEHFPNAAVTFDKFHVIKTANEAVDKVRRSERKSCIELKNTRYIWLKNEKNLTKKQKQELDKLKDCELDTAKAYQMKICLQEIYSYPASIAPMVLEDWIQWAKRCRLQPMIDTAKMIHNHFNGVIRWFTSKLNNGLLEGVNSLIQAAKRKARGYRSDKNLIAMIYLIGGKLDFKLRY
jgi:transposase